MSRSDKTFCFPYSSTRGFAHCFQNAIYFHLRTKFNPKMTHERLVNQVIVARGPWYFCLDNSHDHDDSLPTSGPIFFL